VPATLLVMGKEKEKKPETESVRLDKSLARRIRRIAAHRDKSVPDYLAEVLKPIVDANEKQMVDEVQRERGDTANLKKTSR
jgi:predicted transcriptional regulator